MPASQVGDEQDEQDGERDDAEDDAHWAAERNEDLRSIL
jgi:hypothetical protein